MAIADISEGIDSLNYTSHSAEHQTVKVYDDLCVVVWKGVNLPIHMSSYSIDSGGNMSDAPLDDYEVYTGDAPVDAFPVGSVCIGNGIVATLFDAWNPYYVVLKTHKIETDGSISHIDTWLVTNWPTNEEGGGDSICNIIHVAGTTYALLLHNDDYRILRTVTINADGTFPETILDEESWYGKRVGAKASLITMGGGIFVVAWESWVSSNLYGLHLNSYSINEAGAITLLDDKSLIAPAERDSHNVCLVAVNSGVIAALYYHEDWGGSTDSFTLRTVAMSGGTFGSTLDTEVITPTGTQPHIIHIAGNIFLYAYRNSGERVRTVTISSTGIIGATVDERDPMGGYFPYLMHVLGNVFTINYASAVNTYGWVVSFTVEYVVAGTGYIWTSDEGGEETELHYIDGTSTERSLEGTVTGNTGDPGYLWIEGIYLYYIDSEGDERRIEGASTGGTGTAGQIWIEGAYLHWIADDGDEKRIQGVAQ